MVTIITVGRDIFAAVYFRDFFPHSAITMATKCNFNRKSCDINSKALCCCVLELFFFLLLLILDLFGAAVPRATVFSLPRRILADSWDSPPIY